MMDLTTLEGADTPGKVAALCSKAMRPDPTDPTHPVGRGRLRLSEPRPDRRRAARAAAASRSRRSRRAFPSGQTPARREARARCARSVELGADEVDMVIDRGAFLSGRYAKVYDEIVQA
mgnify:CR=1 FL=1